MKLRAITQENDLEGKGLMLDKEKLLQYLNSLEDSAMFSEHRLIISLINKIKSGKFDVIEIKETCKWETNIDNCDQIYYITSCGESFHFTYSKLSQDPNFKHCPYCGKPIDEAKND